MNKEIIQREEKIEIKKILKKEFYPSWFFTNEKIADFLSNQEEAERVFSIGGGGDFVFNYLSSFSSKRIDICDRRPLSCITIDLKIALFKKFSKKEIKEIFTDYKKRNREEVYKKIREDITIISRNFYEELFKKSKSENFIKSLSRSGYWYKDSFFQIDEEYILYLKEEKSFKNNINIYYGDFTKNLSLQEDSSYDLIYTSNILDSKKDCQNTQKTLKTIKAKLRERGKLIISTQKPQKVVKEIEAMGLQKKDEEIHEFRLVDFFTKDYPYSFICFYKK
jgi:hypothetical protein